MTATATRSTAGPRSYDEAVQSLRHAFAWNPWFLDLYWPESAPRVRRMADAARRAFPDPSSTTVLDVGCGNGFIAYLFRTMGYRVIATDASTDEHRDAMFSEVGIVYRPSNLNDSDPLSGVATPESADIVLLGEVIEHILYHPLGLLRATYRVLKPGGVLILTTPNPSTLMNAVRVLSDTFVLWGTEEFAHAPKLTEDGRLLTAGEIHYREYPARVMADLLRAAGYDRVEPPIYTAFGSATGQPVVKRAVKQMLARSGLLSTRLLGAGYVLVAHRAAH